MIPLRDRLRGLALVSALLVLVGTAERFSATASQQSGTDAIVRLLAAGQPVFGIFSGEHTPEQGAAVAKNREIDFVFYSLERGPFDIPGMQAYMRGMRDVAGAEGPRPFALRVPPIRDGADVARERVARALEAGVDAIVFPHVENAADAAVAVSAMGPELWPGNPEGRLVNMLIVEDKVGVAHVRETVATPGVGVVFAGPGDLRRAYEGDMVAVEHAIQTVLGACKEFDVACGITAGVNDIAERLEQGFRVIIVTQPEALGVGKRAAGRVH